MQHACNESLIAQVVKSKDIFYCSADFPAIMRSFRMSAKSPCFARSLIGWSEVISNMSKLMFIILANHVPCNVLSS
jgi:hypothetical protein